MTSRLSNDSAIVGIETVVADGDLTNSEVSLYLNTTSKALEAKWKDDTGAARTNVVGTNNTLSNLGVVYVDSNGAYATDAGFIFDAALNTFASGDSHSVTSTFGNNAIVGGSTNTISGTATRSVIFGGLSNSINAQSSYAFGSDVTITHTNNLIFNAGTAIASSQANAVIFKTVQGVGITDSGATMPIDASALFQVDSTTQGVLIPRMTTTQRDNIPSPSTGLEIYNTTTNEPNYYNGTSWVSAASGSTEATHNTDWTGVWAADQAGNIEYKEDGTFVTLVIPAVSATANTNAVATNVTALPAGIRPAADFDDVFIGTDNGTDSFVRVTIGSATGTLTIGVGASGAAFTGSGTTGWRAFSVTYKV